MSDWFEDIVIGALESGEKAIKKAVDSVLGDVEHTVKKKRRDIKNSIPVETIDVEIVDEKKEK
jgi:hypothetical protein